MVRHHPPLISTVPVLSCRRLTYGPPGFACRGDFLIFWIRHQALPFRLFPRPVYSWMVVSRHLSEDNMLELEYSWLTGSFSSDWLSSGHTGSFVKVNLNPTRLRGLKRELKVCGEDCEECEVGVNACHALQHLSPVRTALPRVFAATGPWQCWAAWCHFTSAVFSESTQHLVSPFSMESIYMCHYSYLFIC